MKTRFNRISKAQLREVCTSPTLGGLLTDYFVELLEDSAAKEIEDHLLCCLHCRNRYLKMLKVMGADPPANILPGGEDECASNDVQGPDSARVLVMNDFKKRCT